MNFIDGTSALKLESPHHKFGSGEDSSMAHEQDFPSDGYIYEHWWTTEKAASEIGMSKQAVILAIQRGRLRGKKIGDKYRGEWRIDPEAAKRYEKSERGPKT